MLQVACGRSAPVEPVQPPGPPPLLPDPSLRITPNASTVEIGDSIQLSLEAKNIDVSKGFIWSVLDSSIVSVDATGVVVAHRKGSTTVLVRPTTDPDVIGDAAFVVR
ncbi:MAG: Ig-like domain-containing protein [Gemmatimonadales bacterium]|nr:Ig-like domain-containing protein [Gemmatimonadales bacterium]